jgi:carbamoylphosphate synthase large subunit
MAINKNSVKPKKYTNRYLRVFSRHPSHNAIRNTIKLPFLAALRLGSTTELSSMYQVVINSIEAIKNSSSKLLMKQCFTNNNVKTAEWFRAISSYQVVGETLVCSNPNVTLTFPIVAKSHFGSRGTGNTLIKSAGEFSKWIANKQLNHYIFEQYYNYVREYRLHIDSEDYFYACRKMLKQDAPTEDRWHRHDSNCVWIMENNENFDKPVNWSEIVKHSIMALNSVGLDVGAVDVRVQSSLDGKNNKRTNPDFIIIEINSAPSFGSVTAEKYTERLYQIATRLWKKK